MNDALMQEEPARDTTVFKKAMKEEATWETDIGMLISQVQVAQVATCSSDMKGLVMDPELKIIRLCYQGYEHLVACQSASGWLASDLRQAMERLLSARRSVVAVTPSRTLRDCILEGSQFLGHVFQALDYGTRFVWFGLRSESLDTIVSWDDRLAELVNERLQPYLPSTYCRF